MKNRDQNCLSSKMNTTLYHTIKTALDEGKFSFTLRPLYHRGNSPRYPQSVWTQWRT